MNRTFLFWLTGSSDIKLQTESRPGMEKIKIVNK